MRKILFSRASECIQPLRALIEQQNHRTLVLWALNCAPRVLKIFEEAFPDDDRPRQALTAGEAWARGDIKMPIAKKAILTAHTAAAEAGARGYAAAEAAAHAVAHAAATIHVETHALGLVFYGLTAFIYAEGTEYSDEIVTRECKIFYERLLYWQGNTHKTNLPWAKFLLRDDVPNKERLLHEKENATKKQAPI